LPRVSVKKQYERELAMDPETVRLIVESIKEAVPVMVPLIVSSIASAWLRFRNRKKRLQSSKSKPNIVIETDSGNIRLQLDQPGDISIESISKINLPNNVNEITRIRLE